MEPQAAIQHLFAELQRPDLTAEQRAALLAQWHAMGEAAAAAAAPAPVEAPAAPGVAVAAEPDAAVAAAPNAAGPTAHDVAGPSQPAHGGQQWGGDGLVLRRTYRGSDSDSVGSASSVRRTLDAELYGSPMAAEEPPAADAAAAGAAPAADAAAVPAAALELPVAAAAGMDVEEPLPDPGMAAAQQQGAAAGPASPAAEGLPGAADDQSPPEQQPAFEAHQAAGQLAEQVQQSEWACLGRRGGNEKGIHARLAQTASCISPVCEAMLISDTAVQPCDPLARPHHLCALPPSVLTAVQVPTPAVGAEGAAAPGQRRNGRQHLRGDNLGVRALAPVSAQPV